MSSFVHSPIFVAQQLSRSEATLRGWKKELVEDGTLKEGVDCLTQKGRTLYADSALTKLKKYKKYKEARSGTAVDSVSAAPAPSTSVAPPVPAGAAPFPEVPKQNPNVRLQNQSLQPLPSHALDLAAYVQQQALSDVAAQAEYLVPIYAATVTADIHQRVAQIQFVVSDPVPVQAPTAHSLKPCPPLWKLQEAAPLNSPRYLAASESEE